MAQEKAISDPVSPAPEGNGDPVSPLTEAVKEIEKAANAPQKLDTDAIPDTEVEAYVDRAVESVRSGDLEGLQKWAMKMVTSNEFWVDIGLIALTLLISFFLFHQLENGKMPSFKRLIDRIPSRRKLLPRRIILVVTTWIVVLSASITNLSCPLLRTYSLILTCFFFINLPSKFITWKSWMSIVSTALFAIVALHILGFLDHVTNFLERLALDLGTMRITALDVLQGIVVFSVLFWLAGFASSLISNRLCKVSDLSPNVRVLLTKAIRIGLFVVTILFTMSVMGIKVTTLAVFGGALGLGLGFGLQKVVSNLVSGIILLADKSIKPGDVIEIGQTYGWINSLNLRYVSVVTRDNKEHLIPNEDLITNPVINWSFSSKLVRIRAPFGISYSSDLRKAIELATECAKDAPRVVASPAPRCNLMGFGDSSVDFELRFWIDDPHNGVGLVRSQVLLSLWDAFHENGIAFPFPQRDVNLRIEDAEALSALARGQNPNEDNT
jgi:small-conductance mechanosensitive channel